MSQTILDAPLSVAHDARGEVAADLLAQARAHRQALVVSGDLTVLALDRSAAALEAITKHLGALPARRSASTDLPMNETHAPWLSALKDALARLAEMQATLQGIQLIADKLGQQTCGVQTPDFALQLEQHGCALADGIRHIDRTHRALVRVATAGYARDASLGALVLMHAFAPLWARVKRTCGWHWAGLQ